MNQVFYTILIGFGLIITAIALGNKNYSSETPKKKDNQTIEQPMRGRTDSEVTFIERFERRKQLQENLNGRKSP